MHSLICLQMLKVSHIVLNTYISPPEDVSGDKWKGFCCDATDSILNIPLRVFYVFLGYSGKGFFMQTQKGSPGIRIATIIPKWSCLQKFLRRNHYCLATTHFVMLPTPTNSIVKRYYGSDVS
jgi:hypothetical protein